MARTVLSGRRMLEGMGRRRAVVVGIDDYPGTDHDLPSCVSDARFAATLLREQFGFDDVLELHDSDATLEAVNGALGAMLDGLTPDDRAVFYYSGHGTQVVRDAEIRESLVLYDLRLDDDVLVAATQALPQGVFTVMLDACFSGGMWKRLDASRIKSYEIVAKSPQQAVAYRPFAGARRAIVGSIPLARKAMTVAPESDASPQLNGLLVSACLENETAAASTPATDGRSAFTFAFGKALAALGTETAIENVLVEVTRVLRDIGIAQSPQLHPPASPPMNLRTPFVVAEVAAPGDADTDDLLTRIANATLLALRSAMQ